MGAMDLRGAVLRGWRLVLLLALLGAAIGLFTAPSAPAGVTGGTIVPGYWTATTIIGPTPGHGGLPLTRVYPRRQKPRRGCDGGRDIRRGRPRHAAARTDKDRERAAGPRTGEERKPLDPVARHRRGGHLVLGGVGNRTRQRRGQRRVGLREPASLGGLQHRHRHAGQRGHQHRGPARPDRQPALWHEHADRQSGAARDQETRAPEQARHRGETTVGLGDLRSQGTGL